MNFTANNHLKYRIGGRLFGFRENPYEKYEVSVGRVDADHYRTSDWLQEQYRIADLIYRDLGKDLVVMLSGGTDSEIVLRSFVHIGIKPRAVFIKFKNDYNIHELVAAQAIADSVGVNLEILPFDIINYVRSGYAQEMAKELQTHKLGFLSVYRGVNELQAPAVMGGSLTFFRNPTPTGSIWKADITESESASIRASIKYNVPLVQEWFSYTPEVMGYFLEDPTIHWVITERYNYKGWTDGMKNEIFQKWMPDIIKKNKGTGYEYLTGFMTETNNLLRRSIIPNYDDSVDGILVDDLRQQLFGNV